MQRKTQNWQPLSGEFARQGRKAESLIFPVPSARLPDGNSPSAVLNKIQRLRQGIAGQKAIRVRDIDRLRALGVHPLGRHRVFRVVPAGDEILAVWSVRDGEHPIPDWPEMIRLLEKIEQVIGRAMVERDA